MYASTPRINVRKCLLAPLPLRYHLLYRSIKYVYPMVFFRAGFSTSIIGVSYGSTKILEVGEEVQSDGLHAFQQHA